MNGSHDARAAFDERFLDEVARLLPDVDVVRWRHGESSRAPLPDAASAESFTGAAQNVARQLVIAWSTMFGDEDRPESLRLTWSPLDSADAVRPEASVRGVPERRDGTDVDDTAARLRERGWSTVIRSRSTDGFSLLGHRDEFRLDVLMRSDDDLLAVRVTGPAVTVGDLAGRLTRTRRDIPWPARR